MNTRFDNVIIQLQHYNPRASSGLQSSIDCGNLNSSSLLKARLYRSTRHIDKLLETVLGAITDSQTRFYVNGLCDVGLGLEMVLRCKMQVILMKFRFLIVSAVANLCEIIHQLSSLIPYIPQDMPSLRSGSYSNFPRAWGCAIVQHDTSVLRKR
jgi:hypothetical protein